jgi:hypothetical protein
VSQGAAENWVMRSCIICAVRVTKARRVRRSRHVAHVGRRQHFAAVRLESVDVQSPARSRRRWKNNIQTDVKEIFRALIGFVWIGIRTGDRFCEDGNESSCSIIWRNSRATVSFSGRSLLFAVIDNLRT